MRKFLSLLLAAALVLAMLPGCGQQAGQEAGGGREQVSIALWSDQLTERYGGYLQETFPEVDFVFYTATNSTDFYRFKQERGDLPDILTVRRFALRDVEGWRDQLMDLSDTELANTFHQSYLRSYTYGDGTVNWLPACAEVDGILANKTLLEENGLSIPTNYQEFVDLCAALREKGIQPFRSNFGADFTCMELLQGLSATQLTSQEGREWRQQYESGQASQLSEEVWLPVFERMAEFIGYAGIGPADLTGSSMELYTAYRNGETAMIRGTPGEAAVYGIAEGSILLPYFGETEADGWYLTYPAFQAAAKETQDPARRQLILDIMAAMLDGEGLRHISGDGTLIAYTKDAQQVLSPVLAPMEERFGSNQLYIRLASSEMFSISQQVVQQMIAGECPDARSAFDAFNRAMGAPGRSAQASYRISTGYPYAFDPQGGNPAASAIMNTLREEVGTQLLIGPACAVAGNISAGDYTEEELRFLTMGESPAVALCEMTGGQLYRYVDYVLATPGIRGAVVNDSTLYVSSGFEIEARRTQEGYELERLTVNGGSGEVERDGTYTVALVGSESAMLQDALAWAGIGEYGKTETAYKQIIVERLVGGKQLAEPTSYITLK